MSAERTDWAAATVLGRRAGVATMLSMGSPKTRTRTVCLTMSCRWSPELDRTACRGSLSDARGARQQKPISRLTSAHLASERGSAILSRNTRTFMARPQHLCGRVTPSGHTSRPWRDSPSRWPLGCSSASSASGAARRPGYVPGGPGWPGRGVGAIRLGVSPLIVCYGATTPTSA